MSGVLRLRVRVLEQWDDVVLTLPPTTSIAAVKEEALAAASVTEDAAGFLVKFRGAEISDETRSLGDEQVPTDAGLIVMRRRRVPVR